MQTTHTDQINKTTKTNDTKQENFIKPKLLIHQNRKSHLNAPLQQKNKVTLVKTFTYKANT